MIYFLALVPATVLTIGGYVAFFLSNRSEGGFRTFGRYLGFWSCALAILVILGAIFAAAQGGRHRGFYYRAGPRFGIMRGAGPLFMMRRFGEFRRGPGNMAPPPPANAPAQSSPKAAPNQTPDSH
jgi:hypothetical protein